MIDWMERARVAISQKRPDPTDETDKTPLSSVLAVAVGDPCESEDGEAFEERAAIREFDAGMSRADAEALARKESPGAIQCAKPSSRIAPLRVVDSGEPHSQGKPDPETTPSHGWIGSSKPTTLGDLACSWSDDATSDGGNTLVWPDPAADAFAAWLAAALRRGMAPQEAEALAERLQAETADPTGRHSCIQCAGLADNGRCVPAQRGQIVGADRRLGPVQTILHRCEGFEPRNGMPC